MSLWGKLVAVGLVAYILAGMMGSAQAFGHWEFIPGFVPSTCYTDDPLWDNTSVRTSEFDHAVANWNGAVTNLGIDHHSSTSFNCVASSYVEVDWVETLGGALGITRTNITRTLAVDIRFATKNDEGVPFQWSFDPAGPPNGTVDFRGVAVHELGHAIGLKHPEYDSQYPWLSWDGGIPTMQNDQSQGGPARTPDLDDIAGGYWMKDRQWVAYPEMGSDAIPYWVPINGTLNSCNSSYACLTNGPSEARYTFRFTVDQQLNRSTPTVRVTWERGAIATGNMKIAIATRDVFQGENGGTGTWTNRDYAPTCFDNSSNWVTCSYTFAYSRTKVRDVRLIIENNTDGPIHLERVEATDAD